MSTDVRVSSNAVALSQQAVETLDYLASLFLELQRTAAKLYDEAYRADYPAERLRDQLIMMVDELGSAGINGSKVLKGNLFEIRLHFGISNYCDPDAVSALRYNLIRRGIAKGVLTDLFTGTVRYAFKESAKAILDRMKLPDEVRKLYQQCASKTPILTVSQSPSAAPAND